MKNYVPTFEQYLNESINEMGSAYKYVNDFHQFNDNHQHKDYVGFFFMEMSNKTNFYAVYTDHIIEYATLGSNIDVLSIKDVNSVDELIGISKRTYGAINKESFEDIALELVGKTSYRKATSKAKKINSSLEFPLCYKSPYNRDWVTIITPAINNANRLHFNVYQYDTKTEQPVSSSTMFVYGE